MHFVQIGIILRYFASGSLCNFKICFSLGRNKRTDVRKLAYRSLVENLNPIILNFVKRKRFHQLFLEEMPWRAQMNLYLASAHFSLLLTKLAERTKMKFGTSPTVVRYRMIISEWNSFNLMNMNFICMFRTPM